MKSIQLLFLILGLGLFGLTSIEKTKNNLKGNWQVATVITESDTLYQFDKRYLTSRFYNSKFSGWSKTKSDIEYTRSCVKGTYWTFKAARLVFENDFFNQSIMMPCWDNISFPGVKEGQYEKENESVRLFNSKNELIMSLDYDEQLEKLTYSNKEFDFQIIFKKQSAK